jgi:Holliday junction DNA helicase RuvB
MVMKPEDIQVLREIASFEQTTPETEYPFGWSWRQVRIWPSTLNRLVIEDLIKVTFSSNSYTGYRLTEKGKVLASEPELVEITKEKKPLEIPDDLFSPIEGYQEIKELVKRVLKAEKPVHILFTGVPSSAKTMFLIELSRVGAVYILGSQASKAGIADILFDLEPTLLLVDEIDRIGTKDIAILLSLAETGIISQAKHAKRRELKLETKIFAASNSLNMPSELISRFLILRFPPYAEAEFSTVTTNILIKRENVEPNLAEYIASRVWQLKSSFPDPRQAVRIARLVTTRDEVDRLIEVLNRFGQGLS